MGTACASNYANLFLGFWEEICVLPDDLSRFSPLRQYSNDRVYQSIDDPNELQNKTTLTYFTFKGISDNHELQAMIFSIVLLIYLSTFCGNMTILLLVCLDPQLHTPMYFFLGNLSLLDISCTTVALNHILTGFISGDNTIVFPSCLAQMYLFSSLACDELAILTAMSYDRYVAICKPLFYHMVMSHRVCVLLATVSWMLGFVGVIPYLVFISGFSCYKSNLINHFFCDLVPLINLSCSDTFVLKIVILIEGLFFTSLPLFLLTFIPYIFIISSILKISSSSGRRKAFYTCSSHLTVVILLYMTLMGQYIIPTSTDSLDFKKLFALFNTALVPMLNPLIYSLKNNDVKSAVKRRVKRIKDL
ncbi:olfactory receptor 2AP1-like [Discoglossus pictus]